MLDEWQFGSIKHKTEDLDISGVISYPFKIVPELLIFIIDLIMKGRKGQLFVQPCSRQGTSSGDYNYYYFEEYTKLYVASFMLSTQMKELLKTKDELVSKLVRLQVQQLQMQRKTQDFNDDVKGSNDQKKKRNRRPAAEIPRHYQCVVEKCQKFYGSEGSLHQHIKIKHPEIYTGEMELSSGEHQPSDD